MTLEQSELHALVVGIMATPPDERAMLRFVGAVSWATPTIGADHAALYARILARSLEG